MALCGTDQIQQYFKSLEKHFKDHIDNVLENSGNNLTEKEYSERINICSKAISEEATKFCLASGDNFTDKNELLQPLAVRLKTATESLVSTHICGCKLFGQISKDFLNKYIVNILKIIGELFDSLKKNNGSYKSVLGNLWSKVDTFISIKKNNVSIVLLKIEESNKLLDDAISELHHEIQEHSSTNVDSQVSNDLDDYPNDDYISADNWTADEIIIVNTVYGVLKTLQAIYTKLYKVVVNVETQRNSLVEEAKLEDAKKNDEEAVELMECLDKVCLRITGLSQLVDETVSHLYTPIEKNLLHQHVKELTDYMGLLLKDCRSCSFMTSNDHLRIDFLEKALEHNLNKFLNSSTF